MTQTQDSDRAEFRNQKPEFRIDDGREDELPQMTQMAWTEDSGRIHPQITQITQIVWLRSGEPQMTQIAQIGSDKPEFRDQKPESRIDEGRRDDGRGDELPQIAQMVPESPEAVMGARKTRAKPEVRNPNDD